MPIPQDTNPAHGDTLAVSLMKLNILVGGNARSGDNANRSAKSIAAMLSGAGGASRLFSNSGAQVELSLNPDGDLIVTQTAGPNAGKSVNLTYGRWA
jgi:hypothetical protein